MNRQWLDRPVFTSLSKAGALAFVVAGPWWMVNAHPALAFAKSAMDSPRNSLGKLGLHIWAKWLSTIAQGLLGHGVTIVLVLLAITALRKIVIRRDPILDTAQRTALIACACAAFPIVIVQSTGVNHLLRYLTPALIPLAILVGVLADRIGWTRRWQYIATLALCFAVQVIMIVAPVVFPNTLPVDPGFANGGLPWRTTARFVPLGWQSIPGIQ